MMIKQSSLALATLLAAASAAATPIDRTIAAGAAGELEVDNVAGSVEIVGWNKKEVHVTGDLQANAERLEVENQQGRIVVRVVLPQESHGGYAEGTKLRINAPRDTSLEVSAISADIAVQGIEGSQRLHSISGSVRTEGFDNDLDVKSISGDVTIDGHDKAIHTRASAVSGDVLLNGISGDIEAKSVSGSVMLRSRSLQRAELESISGRLDVEGALAKDARVDATTTSGRVKLQFAGAAAAEYTLSSFSGGIDNCFGPKAGHTGFGSQRELHFSEGISRARVYARTMSGRIELCKR